MAGSNPRLFLECKMTEIILTKVSRDFGDGTEENIKFDRHEVKTLAQLMAAYGNNCEYTILIKHPMDPLTTYKYTIVQK
jgi:glycerophosphoryl diester phosphodiesterase